MHNTFRRLVFIVPFILSTSISLERDYRSHHRCLDGSNVTVDMVCDGRADCPDGSDETHALCRKMLCPSYLFRCTYGACVDGTAPCNNVTDCADNSDELLPRCRQDRDYSGDKFKCANGEEIDLFLACDGSAQCADASDEALRACAGAACASNLFQCAYGACVDEGADCNDIQECADWSDEDPVLCNKTVTTTTSTTTTEVPVVNSQSCVIPNHPKNGFYRPSISYLDEEEKEKIIYLTTICTPGFKLVGEETVLCVGGIWSVQTFPQCLRACKLEPSDSVVYRCVITDVLGTDTTRECGAEEVGGSLVQPECRRPNYFSTTELPYMVCSDGKWNYQPKCIPECGTVTPRGTPLIVGGEVVERGEVTWHAGIYWKDVTDGRPRRRQICGGSLISTTVVLSAAHCFWDEQLGQLPAHHYSVAVGKLYRSWDHPRDALYAQKRDVRQIVLADHFYGSAINYQYDLAVVVVAEQFYYRTFIRPVCLDFDVDFNRQQLSGGNLGKVAGWGLTTGLKGSEAPALKVLELPFVPYEQCVRLSDRAYLEFLAGDKICAGYGNGTALCKGDSGGGLAFPSGEPPRYYVRGVVSTSPPPAGAALCNLFALTSFTEVLQHAALVQRYWFV